MIAVVYGTTGELIKLAPVVSLLQKAGADLDLWCTGQQAEELTRMSEELQLPPPDLILGKGFRGNPLTKAEHIPTWLGQVSLNFAYSFRRQRARARSNGPSIVLVHGDTLTTVIGALMGKALGVPVGHIEAGMRSHDWRHPFPEELNRRFAARIADLHFAPGPMAVSNLRQAHGTVVDTYFNTVRDSLDLVPDTSDDLERLCGPLPDRFGIVSLHRFEFLREAGLVASTMATLQEGAATTPLLFVSHAVTMARIHELGLHKHFDDRFRPIPKLPYFNFVTLVRRSAFAVTDSGGLQQESFYLGHPCLVHRATTESYEGLGMNVVLSRLEPAEVLRFLADPDRYALPRPPEGPSPSQVIVDELRSRGFCG